MFTLMGTGITVDTAQKFSGTKSLHVRSTGGATAMLNFTQQFPFNNEFGRLMIFVPTKPNSDNHFDILQSVSATNAAWEAGGQFGNFELVVDPPDNGLDSNTPFPQGNAWHCIQWNFQGNIHGTKLDGVFVNMSPAVGRWTNGTGWRNLTVGFQIFGTNPPAADFWIDDLAFGEQEIPCPAQ